MIPASLLDTHDLLTRFPDRKQDILTHAIATRERELILLGESRHVISWHPVHTLKTILVAGFIAFALSFLLSQVVAIGKFYSQARDWRIDVPLPIIGTKTIDLGGGVPTSTALGIAGKIPSYGLRESVFAAIAVMITILLERAVTSFIQWKKIKKLRAAEHELRKDMETLEQWMRSRTS